jgi:hypothetical protein
VACPIRITLSLDSNNKIDQCSNNNIISSKGLFLHKITTTRQLISLLDSTIKISMEVCKITILQEECNKTNSRLQETAIIRLTISQRALTIILRETTHSKG